MSANDPRRRTPRADSVLAHPQILQASGNLGIGQVKRVVTQVLDACRRGDVPPSDVVERVLTLLPIRATSMKRVINATGVIVHTNLGRAPLSHAAVEALHEAAGTTDVELDLQTGLRGKRGHAAVTALLDRLPDAGGAHIVNNGAAAIALTACALAAGREVIIARGEMVEIGDGFRVPDLVESVGAHLREVGTTNRVHLEDYQDAVSPSTGFILKVHPSNFVVSGFTKTVGVPELSSLSVSTVVDIGSGLLAPHPRLPDEPDATSMLRAGADLVIASGDKLLGGPQCGLILGRPDLIELVRRHPLARALRVSKLTLAALEATLNGPMPPVATSLEIDLTSLRLRAEAIQTLIESAATIDVVPSTARVGGGGAPGVELPSIAIALPAAFEVPLRTDSESPVIGRVHDGRLLLDLIAVQPTHDATIVETIRRHLATAHDR